MESSEIDCVVVTEDTTSLDANRLVNENEHGNISTVKQNKTDQKEKTEYTLPVKVETLSSDEELGTTREISAMESSQIDCVVVTEDTKSLDANRLLNENEQGNISTVKQNKTDQNEKTEYTLAVKVGTLSNMEESGTSCTVVGGSSSDQTSNIQDLTFISQKDADLTIVKLEKIVESDKVSGNKEEGVGDASLIVMGYRGDDEDSGTDSDTDSDSSSSASSSDKDMVTLPSNTNNIEEESFESVKDDSVRKAHNKNILKSLREDIRTRGEIFPDELPPLEHLTITVDEEEEMMLVGKVTGIVDILVVIQSEKDIPTLNEDTALFTEDRQFLGKIFEVFGPVCLPMYSVRFNSPEDIVESDMEIGLEVFCAPRKRELTQYVFVDQLKRVKGSDASWEDNHEPPSWVVEYSDDEEERKAKAIRKKAKQAQNGQTQENSPNGGTSQRRGRTKRTTQPGQTNGTDNQSYRTGGHQGAGENSSPLLNPGMWSPGPRPQFPPNPWQHNWQEGRPPHPGRFSGEVNHGFGMPYGPGPCTFPPSMFPYPNPQMFAGPPQFMAGPRYSQGFQQAPNPAIFGMHNMAPVGQCPNNNSRMNPDNPPTFARPPLGAPSKRTSLLGPAPGGMTFRGAPMNSGRTFPHSSTGHQMGDSQPNGGPVPFEHHQNISTTNNNIPPPIDRRYIQNSNNSSF